MGIILVLLLGVGLTVGILLSKACLRWYRSQEKSGKADAKLLFYGSSMVGFIGIIAAVTYISPSGGGAPSNDDYISAAIALVFFLVSPGVSFLFGSIIVLFAHRRS